MTEPRAQFIAALEAASNVVHYLSGLKNDESRDLLRSLSHHASVFNRTVRKASAEAHEASYARKLVQLSSWPSRTLTCHRCQQNRILRGLVVCRLCLMPICKPNKGCQTGIKCGGYYGDDGCDHCHDDSYCCHVCLHDGLYEEFVDDRDEQPCRFICRPCIKTHNELELYKKMSGNK